MKNNFFKTVKNSIRHWYIPLIGGLLFVLVGFYTLFSPIESYVALSIIFSISFLVSGISEIYFSIANREEIDSWGWSLTFGVITLFIGILLILNPIASAISLAFYVGFLILFRSIMGISYALELKNYRVLDWGNLMVISILGLLFSFLLIWNPLFAGMTIIFWTGITLIIGGIFSIYLSFKLKKINAMPGKISNELKARYEDVKQQIQNELNKS